MSPIEYPVCLTVKEVASILRVGKNKAYDMVKMKDFPSIIYGSRIIIPRDEFFRWIHEKATHREVS